MHLFSLDTETTGLNPRTDQVISMALVYEDTNAFPLWPIHQLPKWECMIHHGLQFCGHWQALEMNRGLLLELSRCIGVHRIKRGGSTINVYESTEAATAGALYWVKTILEKVNIRPVLIGKNVAGFDLQFLGSDFKRTFSHRIIDVGSLAMGVDSDRWGQSSPPSLGALLDRGKTVSHEALEDARDVLRVARKLTSHYGRCNNEK